MKKTTLCYLQLNGKYLMLFRNKKANDPNEGKCIGVGGKFLPGESPEECLLREMREETGFALLSYEQRGIVHFLSDQWEDEDMYLFTATSFRTASGEVYQDAADGCDVPSCEQCSAAGGACGELPADFWPVPECAEGTFMWVPINRVPTLPLWEGDMHFLTALAAGERDIDMTLRYEGDSLAEVVSR
ncbi:MAG: 8-oxo-dGTP diphosphatase [Eggerthellales bacterium]|nr:8-oxo-dGTP diphosphatase [Eggerthellales bacterium]